MFKFITRDPVVGNRQALVYVMLARLLVLIFMLLFLGATLSMRLADSAVYVFIAVTFLATIPYALWLRKENATQAWMLYQFAVDVLIITGLIHFTGGLTSQLILLYPLVILCAGVVGSGKFALKITVLSIVLYSTLVALEAGAVLAYRGGGEFPYAQTAEVFQVLMLRVFILVLFAAAGSYLADTCFYQEKQLRRVRDIADSILDNVAVPLMAVYEDGRIMLANPASAAMLGVEQAHLRNRSLEEFFPESRPDWTKAAAAARVWKMRRVDGGMFPVSFQISHGNFPAAVIGSLTERGGGVDLYLVAFRDMTDIVNRAGEAEQDTRRKTAAGMIAEMAHVVRNPLTAIRGAGEILNAAVDSMFEKSETITEADWAAVKEMSNLIFQQTKELDDKVDYFLQCASRDPAKLLELATEADNWAAKIMHAGGGRNG